MHRFRGSAGFTLLELLVVLVIGGVMSTVAIRSFSQVHGNLGAGTAQATFLTMHAQARSLAVERGEAILLVVDPTSDLVTIETADGTVVRSRDFASDYDISIQAGGEVRLCMTPRGYADPGCGNVSGRTEVTFARGDRTRMVALLPLGQAVEE